MRWLGIDADARSLEVAELTKEGKVQRWRVALDAAGLAAFKESLGPDVRIALEASTHSARLRDELAGHVDSVVVVHPAQVSGTSSLHVKTDMRDAEALARLLESGFVRPVWVGERDCRSLRSLTEYRQAVVQLRTQTINRLRNLLRSELLEYPRSALLSKKGLQFLSSVEWPHPQLALVAQSLVRCGEYLSTEVETVDRSLADWAASSPRAQLLLTIPGIGCVLAAVLVAEIGDVQRFPTAAKLCAYAGLVPKVHFSGQMRRISRLTHGGRRQLRWAAWWATLCLVRKDAHFAAFYRRVNAAHPKGVARVACARKLLTVIWHMLRSAQPFRLQAVAAQPSSS